MKDKVIITFKKDGGITIDTTIKEKERAKKLMECYAAFTSMLASEIGFENETLLNDFLNMARDAGIAAAKEMAKEPQEQEREEKDVKAERDSE